MRKIRSLIFLLALVSHATNVLAEASLCEDGEVNFSSCMAGEKVASFCASSNLSTNNGYFQYRFGTPKKVEFVFPAERKNPYELFFNSMSPDGLENRISFKNGNYRYIFFGIDSRHGASFGIYILKNGKLIKTLPCTDQFSDQDPAAYSIIKKEKYIWFN